MSPDELEQLIARFPVERPFRFVDRVLELTEKTVKASYRFREDEFFFPAHFPGFPIVPGTILLECMLQSGLLLQGLRLVDELRDGKSLPVFCDSESFEVFRPVFPGQTVIVEGEVVFFRLGKLRSKVAMRSETGELLAKAEVAGVLMKAADRN